jgi:hypothetical protein
MAQRTLAMVLPPFCLDPTMLAPRRRPDNAVDARDGSTYRRALEVDGSTIDVASVQIGSFVAP